MYRDMSLTPGQNARIASFFYQNGIAINVADSTSFVWMIEESMEFAKQNPLQSVQSQVTSASLCERSWSAHGHIHTRIRNRLEPATTGKLVYVYSNSQMMVVTRDADELKMFAWILKMLERSRSTTQACQAGVSKGLMGVTAR